jgi:lysozyme family protein
MATCTAAAGVSVLTNRGLAAPPTQIGFSDSENTRLNAVVRSAQRQNLEVPLGLRSRGLREATRIDISQLILNALDRFDADRSALDVASAGGALLSSVNQRLRDAYFPGIIGRGIAPAFDAVEKADLRKKFQDCQTLDPHRAEIQAAAKFILSPSAKARYVEVAAISKVPWYVIGAIHYREASLNFYAHLYNGDRLDRKTTDVPANKPPGVWPPSPFDPKAAWRTSAVDALHEFDNIHAWTLEEMLYGFEQYNGFGYRGKKIASPYVWNYSQYYTKGGFPRDRQWDSNYVSRQAGLGVLVKELSVTDQNDIKITTEA